MEIYGLLSYFENKSPGLMYQSIVNTDRGNLMIRFLYLKGYRAYYVLLQHTAVLRNSFTLNPFSLYQSILVPFASMLALSIDAGAKTTWILKQSRVNLDKNFISLYLRL